MHSPMHFLRFVRWTAVISMKCEASCASGGYLPHSSPEVGPRGAQRLEIKQEPRWLSRLERQRSRQKMVTTKTCHNSAGKSKRNRAKVLRMYRLVEAQ